LFSLAVANALFSSVHQEHQVNISLLYLGCV